MKMEAKYNLDVQAMPGLVSTLLTIIGKIQRFHPRAAQAAFLPASGHGSNPPISLNRHLQFAFIRQLSTVSFFSKSLWTKISGGTYVSASGSSTVVVHGNTGSRKSYILITTGLRKSTVLIIIEVPGSGFDKLTSGALEQALPDSSAWERPLLGGHSSRMLSSEILS
jgi:hypothetical protein